MVDYLGSTINAVASTFGLVTVIICVLSGAGLWIWPAVLVAYVIAPPGPTWCYDDPQDRTADLDCEASPRRLLTPSSIF